MTAYNIVRMRARPGQVDALLAHWGERPMHPGMTGLTIVRTGERDLCLIGAWTDMDAIVAARPAMIAYLNAHRDLLEDLGGGRGTDPVSGEALLERSS